MCGSEFSPYRCCEVESVLAVYKRSPRQGDAAQVMPVYKLHNGCCDKVRFSFLHDLIYGFSGFAERRFTCRDYRRISDDSPPTFATSVGNLLASFRPDRALSPTPVDPPRELFKNQ